MVMCLDDRIAHLPAQTCGLLGSGTGVRVGQQDQEFLTPIAPRQVRVTDLFL
jgi:hypothetical protein